MSDETNTIVCRVPSCARRTGKHTIMCVRCWELLSEDEQREYYAAARVWLDRGRGAGKQAAWEEAEQLALRRADAALNGPQETLVIE